MNIEVANRLVNLRKQMGLSQEQLAEKIGVSRQAVSKWERSEASPDTDNLILLARLYNISLDELLKTDDDIPLYEKETNSDSDDTENSFDNENDYNETSDSSSDWKTRKGINVQADNGDRVHVGFDGIHVIDHKGTSVQIGLGGINVSEATGDSVTVGEDGVYINGEKQDIAEKIKKSSLITAPIALLAIIAFLGVGLFMNGWWYSWLILLLIPVLDGIVKAIVCRRASMLHGSISVGCVIAFLSMGLFMGGWWYSWLTLLLIPILSSLIEAIRKRKLSAFAFPVLIALIYLGMGMFMGLWHPGWAIFLLIPVYYIIINICKSIRNG